MDQSKLESLVETCVNTIIGFLVAFMSQIVVFPLVGLHDVSIAANLEIGAWLTLISVARGYIIRRWFNARLRQALRKMTTAGGH